MSVRPSNIEKPNVTFFQMWSQKMCVDHEFNPFHVTTIFLYPLKDVRKPEVFRDYRKRLVA